MEASQQICLSALPSLKDSRQTEIVVVVAVMTVVSTIAVVLRLLGRRISIAKYGADDFLIVVALILTYGLNANEIIAVHYGFGKHQLILSLDHISKFLLNDWTIQLIFATAITVTRFSLLVFYHRIFPVKRFTIVAIITGCILMAWWIGFIFAIVFSCRPVASFWNKALIDHCVNEHTLSWGVTGSELATNTDASSSVCLPLMRPLISHDLSTLINRLRSSVSRRTGSASTDEEATSSSLPSLGKLCNEKPSNGPCPDLIHPADKYRHISQCQTHPPKPVHEHGNREVGTHRSRIESYTPEMFDCITLEKSKPSSTAKADLHVENRVKAPPVKSPPQFLHNSATFRDPKRKTHPITAKPLAMKLPPARLRPASTDHYSPSSRRAPPLSMNPPPAKRRLSSNHPETPASQRAQPLAMNPPSSQPTSTGHPTSSRIKPSPTTLPHLPESRPPATSIPRPNQPRPPSKSSRATRPAIGTTSPVKKHMNRKPQRLSEEQMNQCYAKWYRGRGSEIGRGYWGVEIIPSSGVNAGGISGTKGQQMNKDDLQETVTNNENKSKGGDGGDQIGIGVAKSRLSS
ncbi:MAG: hypothetical protein Q9168_001238 [Polycauliona sp. 1 TL-2023]